MKKKVILHIGKQKSGTSSLQLMLSKNEVILKKMGYVYPKSLRAPIAHHPLANWYNKNKNVMLSHSQLEDFWNEIESSNNVILSSEAFQNIKPKSLSKDFEKYDLTIVLYLRDQISYLLSSYAQSIKARKVTWTIEEYEKRLFKLDYLKFVNKWTRAFPNANIIVRVFNRKHLLGGDISKDFLVHSGICRENELDQFIQIKEDENPSIGGALLEFKRLLNFTDYDTRITQGKLYKILQKIAVDNDDYKLKKIIPESIFNRVKEKYLEGNTLMSQKYLEANLTIDETFTFGNQQKLDETQLEDIIERIQIQDKKIANILRLYYVEFIKATIANKK